MMSPNASRKGKEPKGIALPTSHKTQIRIMSRTDSEFRHIYAISLKLLTLPISNSRLPSRHTFIHTRANREMTRKRGEMQPLSSLFFSVEPVVAISSLGGVRYDTTWDNNILDIQQ